MAIHSNWLVVSSWLLGRYLVGSSLVIIVVIYQVLSQLQPKSSLWSFLLMASPLMFAFEDVTIACSDIEKELRDVLVPFL